VESRQNTTASILERLKPYELDPNTVEINNFSPLGRGSHAHVYKGYINGGDQPFAMKCIDKQKYKQSSLHEEIRIMAILKETNAPHTVFPHGYCEKPKIYVLCMDYVANDTLQEHLDKLNLPQKKKIILGMAQAVAHFHQYNIIHCDLKPANVLLTENWMPKICDFDLAYEMVGDIRALELGTPLFLAPEILFAVYERLCNGTVRRGVNDKKTDIYSFALLVWCTVIGHGLPHLDVNAALQKLGIVDIEEEKREGITLLAEKVVKRGEREVIPDFCPAYIKNVIQPCWDTDPNKRLDMSEVVRVLEEGEAAEALTCMNGC
jgi:serine/threonine protein kinase